MTTRARGGALLAALALASSGCTTSGPPAAEDSPSRGSEAPDAAPWERLVDEGTGIGFDFPVEAEPVADEQVTRAGRVDTYTYSHRTGTTELVVVIEDIGGRLRVTDAAMVRTLTLTLEAAGDKRVRCVATRGDVRRMRTTCHSVDEQGRARITMGIARAFRLAVSTVMVASTAEPGEEPDRQLVRAAAEKIADSMSPRGEAI